jgi:uncharacterized membrane protein YqjE
MAGHVEVNPKQSDRSLGELFGQLTSDVGTLLRKEVALARLETKEELQRAGKAGGMLGGAAVVGILAAIMLSFALAWLLDSWMHPALAFAIVGVLWVAVAAVLYGRGRTQLKSVNPVPEQTVETLKEDLAWARAQKS